MLIECTKKLADAMKIKMCDITPIKREPFYEWHANLFLFDRRKGGALQKAGEYCFICNRGNIHRRGFSCGLG